MQVNIPATQALRKQTKHPATIARAATLLKSALLEGHKPLKAPICIPMLDILLNPQSAYVEMV